MIWLIKVQFTKRKVEPAPTEEASDIPFTREPTIIRPTGPSNTKLESRLGFLNRETLNQEEPESRLGFVRDTPEREPKSRLAFVTETPTQEPAVTPEVEDQVTWIDVATALDWAAFLVTTFFNFFTTFMFMLILVIGSAVNKPGMDAEVITAARDFAHVEDAFWAGC